jgi:hypothetical protein
MSAYAAFEVKIDNDDGTTTMLPGQTVHAFNVTGLAVLADVTSDGAGVVPAGAYSGVAAGSLVRFYFSIPYSSGNANTGVCGYSEIFTT